MRKIWKMCLSMMMIFSLALGNVNAVKANSQDQMIEIKNRLKTYFLDLDTIDDGSKVETCYVNQANKYLKLIEEDGSFKDVDYKSTTNAANGGAWSPYLALDRMQAIAIAYHKEGNDLYQKKEVIEKLQKAINYWNTQNPRSTNWWENQVGVQLRFSRIALFMEDIIDDESYQILLNKLLEKKPVKYGTGQNNLWFDQNYVYYSLLSNDKDQLKDMVNNYLNYCLSIQLDDITSEAVQVDNSFYMHGRQFYSNGYGMSMFRDMSFWIYMLRDTDFAIGQDVIDRMADYMLDGTSWTIRGDIMELYLGYRPYKYEVGYENYASEYIEPLKRMIVSDKKNAKKYQDVLNNITGESSSNGKNGHYYMWRSGYASHMRETYGVNIKMDSQNIIGGEWRGSWPSGQDQGQLIYWTSSAVSTVTVDGDEYTNVYPVYDWAHCPGATTPNRIVKDYSNSGRFMNGTDHTIGVSDGKYGSTAYVMDKKGTQATKGYFFFDDEFVALGAGINSTETTSIHTTLNQCEANQIKVNGESVSLGTVGKEYNTNYIYNDKIGYVFLENTKVNVSYDSQKDAASLWNETKKQEASDVFTAYLDHGVKPTDASYAYIVVPDKNENEVKQYANNIPVTIIVNNKNVQAVRHDGLKQTQIHFYSAGSLEYKPGYTITVDKPCSMIIDESSENRKITAAVSDDQAMQTIQVQLSHDMQTTTTTFVSAALPYAGKSMTLNEGENDRYHASSCTDNHGVENIVDSSEKTYWESENNQEQWISVFTGTNQFIKSMNITWGDHFASQYDVYISQDGKNYQLLQSITDGNGGKDDISINELCSYVKIIMKESNDNNYQIKDISFYSSQLLSLNKNVETSSVSIQAPTFIGSLSVDGDLNTRWASVRNEDDNWITIDLGKKANIDAIEILWEAACSDNYQIEVSDDNKEWTIVKQDLKTDSRLSDHLSFEKQVTGRYIKIHSLKSRKVNNINYGINIFEINIYGTYQRFETNIALNKQTETSSQSTQAPTYTGDLTVDGDLKTRWASLRNENDNWITIDLGKKAAIDDIVINWEAACSDNYQIEISDDHQEWTIVKKNLKTNSDYNDKISFDESIEARYVKIHSLKSKTLKYGINIYEIEIYGEYLEEEIPEVNIALNKPAYASSEYTNPNSNFTLKAQYAFDGSVENKGDTYQSRWVSQRRKDNPNTDVDAQYIYVDLQDYYDISKIVLNWEGACAKEYQLQVSTDGKTWQDIEHITDGKSGVITFTYDQEVIARYVEMKGIEPATQYGYSLWEFEVYGTKVTVDKSGLKELIETVSATDETQYTPNSYQVFKKALDNANEIYNKELVTKEEVEDAENTLRQAYQSLIKKVDNSQLLQLIQKAEEIDRSLYTLDSVKKLENAIREAKEISQNQNITKDEMDLAITHLNQAIDHLVKLDKKALTDLLSEIENMDLTLYTEESIASLKEVVKEAQNAFNSQNQDEIDQAYEKLLLAKNELKEKESMIEETDKDNNNDRQNDSEQKEQAVDTSDHIAYETYLILGILSLGTLLYFKKKMI